MPSAVTHIFVGLVSGEALSGRGMPWRFWALTAACAVLPDFDFIFYLAGAPEGHILGHRGFTHSICFALITGLAVMLIFYRQEKFLSKKWWGFFLYYFFITSSNGLLDMLSLGHLGVAIFFPFDLGRYFLPWRFLHLSPVDEMLLFRGQGLIGLLSEMHYIWLPALVVALAIKMLRNCYRHFLSNF